MSVSVSVYPSTLNSYVASSSDLDENKVQVLGSAIRIYKLYLDNSANSAPSYFKAWNVAAASVTVGTTVPDFVWPVAAGEVSEVLFDTGVSFGTALTIACVTTGGTGGTTGPTEAVAVELALGS